MKREAAPRYVQLNTVRSTEGAWHWIKQSTETKTTHWLITGCGGGFYANDAQVAKRAIASNRFIETTLCGRCKSSRAATERRRSRLVKALRAPFRRKKKK